MSFHTLANTLASLGLSPQEATDVILTTANRQIAEAVSSATGVIPETPARRSRSKIRRQRQRYEPYPVRSAKPPVRAPRSEYTLPREQPTVEGTKPHTGSANTLDNASDFNAALLAKVELSTAPPTDTWDGKPRLKDVRYRL